MSGILMLTFFDGRMKHIIEFEKIVKWKKLIKIKEINNVCVCVVEFLNNNLKRMNPTYRSDFVSLKPN